MAGNTGDGSRKGYVKGRTQVYNSKTKTYVKRSTETGKIMGSKKTPYKGVKKVSKKK